MATYHCDICNRYYQADFTNDSCPYCGNYGMERNGGKQYHCDFCNRYYIADWTNNSCPFCGNYGREL